MGLFGPEKYQKLKGNDHVASSTAVSTVHPLVSKEVKAEASTRNIPGLTEEKESVFSFNNEDMVSKLNQISKNRFDTRQSEFFDSHDKDILKAVKYLKSKGEDPNPNMIKAMMAIETGFKPRRNQLGYEGYPQTNEHILNYINKKHKQNFSMNDLYDVEKSAKFMHYYMKDLKRSKHIENDSDIAAAYNWGIGNLGKYKNKLKTMPVETSNYVKFIDTMKKYF